MLLFYVKQMIYIKIHKYNIKIKMQIEQMKIIDCFTFYNEIELLYYRLSILYEFVDFFVIVESNITHSGKKKDLIFESLKKTDRFISFLNKIIYVIDTGLVENPIIENYEYTNSIWLNENHQRNTINDGIDKIKHILIPTDFIIISDLDEIPKPSMLQELKSIKQVHKLKQAYALVEDMYFYNLTCFQYKTRWINSKMVQYGVYCSLFDNSPQKIRLYHESNPNYFTCIESAGWHLSYFTNIDGIINKLNAFSHQELNTDKYKNTQYIQSCIKNKKCFINPHMDLIQYIPIDENENLPYLYNVYLTQFYGE